MLIRLNKIIITAAGLAHIIEPAFGSLATTCLSQRFNGADLCIDLT